MTFSSRCLQHNFQFNILTVLNLEISLATKSKINRKIPMTKDTSFPITDTDFLGAR